jgi:predicted alpha/beta hydrolase family esterase
MKNALILHGTDASSSANWFPWLKKELESRGYTVWVPDLPHAEKPNIQRYNEFLLANKEWVFNEDTIIVGHSSGAVAILGLLEALPEHVVVNKCFLVGSFKDDLGWESLKDLFLQPFDFEKIKKHAKEFIFIHSDNDPYCPLEHAKYLADKVGGKLILKPGEGHFSGNHVTIPEIVEILNLHS